MRCALKSVAHRSRLELGRRVKVASALRFCGFLGWRPLARGTQFSEKSNRIPGGATLNKFRGRATIAIVLAGVVAAAAAWAQAAVTPPSPGVVAGGFCTYGKGYFANSPEAAQRINQFFGTSAIPEIFHVGSGSNTYTW